MPADVRWNCLYIFFICARLILHQAEAFSVKTVFEIYHMLIFAKKK